MVPPGIGKMATQGFLRVPAVANVQSHDSLHSVIVQLPTRYSANVQIGRELFTHAKRRLPQRTQPESECESANMSSRWEREQFLHRATIRSGMVLPSR